MNTVTQLLQDLQRRGVTVRAVGDRIGFKPADAVPPELVERMRRHKTELLAMLRGRNRRPPVGPLPVQPSAFTTTPKGFVVPNDLPEPWQEFYLERCGVREFCGNQSREHAEAGALAETLAAMEQDDAP
ncbi:MAG: hypothetical protein HOP29_17220 [Phycisphaerales bacterium]|nr:hypothetical protein [Phycisphaerales bacterium]